MKSPKEMGSEVGGVETSAAFPDSRGRSGNRASSEHGDRDPRTAVVRNQKRRSGGDGPDRLAQSQWLTVLPRSQSGIGDVVESALILFEAPRQTPNAFGRGGKRPQFGSSRIPAIDLGGRLQTRCAR